MEVRFARVCFSPRYCVAALPGSINILWVPEPDLRGAYTIPCVGTLPCRWRSSWQSGARTWRGVRWWRYRMSHGVLCGFAGILRRCVSWA